MIKVGQLWKSKTSSVVIEITGRQTGNGHWNSKKISGGKSHKIFDKTLFKFYELITK
jgi:hypothetical protein